MHLQTQFMRQFFCLNEIAKVMIVTELKGQPGIFVQVQLHYLEERASFNELVPMETK